MRRSWLLIPALLFIATPALSQSAPTDSQTLQALLAEVRQLRRDLQTTTIAAQRAQILLYRLQVQQEVVRRVQQRLDDAGAKLLDTQAREKNLSEQIKRMEENPDNSRSPADEKEVQAVLPQFKAQLEILADQEQQWQAKKSDADQELRLEQAKLGTLEADLDRLERSLDSLGRASGGIPQ